MLTGVTQAFLAPVIGAFSHFSGVVWTLQADAAFFRSCKGTEFLLFNDGSGYVQR